MFRLFRQLLANPMQIILTSLGIGILYLTLPGLLDWLVFSATFSGNEASDCTAQSGACWVFIKDRFSQLMLGFYPIEEAARVGIGLGLFILSFALINKTPIKKSILAILTIMTLCPFIIWHLLHGPFFGLNEVTTDKWGGLMLTLIVSISGIIVSLPFGVVLALGRRSELVSVRWASIGFIELWRGVPLITVLFMSSVMLPLFLPPDQSVNKLLRALIAVAMFSSAYMAEVIRGGLQAIPKGQFEAAHALGLTYWQSMSSIILPQAIKHVIPGIVNTFIGLFKDTTLVAIIGMFDLLGVVQAAMTDPEWLDFALEGYVFAGLIFWVFCWSMSFYSRRLENSAAS